MADNAFFAANPEKTSRICLAQPNQYQ